MKIAFASCMNAEHHPSQPVWAKVTELRPDALLLLGDQIYMDWGFASLARRPRLRRLFDRDPAEAKALFADQMHGCYAMQWAVPEFRAMVRAFVNQRGAKRLYVCRDEHDFAWNNAYGKGDESHDRSVPQPLVEMSNALFAQFRSVLANPDEEWAAGSYPSIDRTLAPAPEPDAQVEGIPILVQEQREHRTPRESASRSLLSSQQKAAMLNAISGEHGPLVIIAGPSPLRHAYKFSNQGWWDAARPYPEYKELLDRAAKHNRAVLYLGGDVHRVAYGGPVEAGSSVVQVLSSGAAVRSLPLGRGKPSLAWLDFDSVRNGGMDGALRICAQVANEPMTPIALQWTNGHWAGQVPDGECVIDAADALQWPLGDVGNAAPDMDVLVQRSANGDHRSQSELDLAPEGLDEHGYGDALPTHRCWPRAVSVGPSEQPGRLKLRAQAIESSDPVGQAIINAFERAKRGSRNVVLFVHGFDKSFSQSLSQAALLRERFDVEPLLFSWPSGDGGNFFAEISDLLEMQERCNDAWVALNTTLAILGQVAADYRNKGTKTVLLARSMGALYLQAAAVGNGGRSPAGGLKEKLGALKRIVLSAPVVPLKRQDNWLGSTRPTDSGMLMHPEVVVTLNRNDRTLRSANWFMPGDPLGAFDTNEDDWLKHQIRGVHYTDWTHVSSVNRSHDYLFRTVTKDADALNRALIRGDDIDWTALPTRTSDASPTQVPLHVWAPDT